MRGAPKICAGEGCGREHWSVANDLCPTCRGCPPSRRTGAISRPRQRVIDHDLPSAPAAVRLGGGRCMGTALAHIGSCTVRWRHLAHRHCPTLGCGRAMSARAERCGACTALELLERRLMPDPFRLLAYSKDAAQEYLEDMQGLPVALEL